MPLRLTVPPDWASTPSELPPVVEIFNVPDDRIDPAFRACSSGVLEVLLTDEWFTGKLTDVLSAIVWALAISVDVDRRIPIIIDILDNLVFKQDIDAP